MNPVMLNLIRRDLFRFLEEEEDMRLLGNGFIWPASNSRINQVTFTTPAEGKSWLSILRIPKYEGNDIFSMVDCIVTKNTGIIELYYDGNMSLTLSNVGINSFTITDNDWWEEIFLNSGNYLYRINYTVFEVSL